MMILGPGSIKAQQFSGPWSLVLGSSLRFWLGAARGKIARSFPTFTFHVHLILARGFGLYISRVVFKRLASFALSEASTFFGSYLVLSLVGIAKSCIPVRFL